MLLVPNRCLCVLFELVSYVVKMVFSNGEDFFNKLFATTTAAKMYKLLAPTDIVNPVLVSQAETGSKCSTTPDKRFSVTLLQLDSFNGADVRINRLQ